MSSSLCVSISSKQQTEQFTNRLFRISYDTRRADRPFRAFHICLPCCGTMLFLGHFLSKQTEVADCYTCVSLSPTVSTSLCVGPLAMGGFQMLRLEMKKQKRSTERNEYLDFRLATNHHHHHHIAHVSCSSYCHCNFLIHPFSHHKMN